MTIAQRLADLGITLPALAVPAAAYVPFVRTGNLIFVSGHIAKQEGKAWVGQLGLTMTTAVGQQAARAPTSPEHPPVTKGAPDLLQQVLGAAGGAHARSAFGVAQLPMGACVEIELIAEVA